MSEARHQNVTFAPRNDRLIAVAHTVRRARTRGFDHSAKILDSRALAGDLDGAIEFARLWDHWLGLVEH